MKYAYKFKRANILLLLAAVCIGSNSFAQTLLVDASAPRVTSIASNGQDLSATTYNYVRVPELLAIDSVSATGDFFTSLRLSWAIFIDSATLPAGIEPKVKTGFSNEGTLPWTISANVARFGSSVKLRSGKILGLEFKPDYVNQHNFPLVYYTSTNNGASYIKHTDGMVNFTQTVLGIRMHKNLWEEPDGTLYTCAYVRFSNYANFRTYVLKSTDGGVTWGPMLDGSGIAIEISGTYATDEGAFTRCADGSWLIIMKNTTSDPDITLPLLYSRSTDKGQTWSAPATLPGIGAAASGKNPHIILMPNGLLALTYGTPDVEITFSSNNGNTWTTPTVTYADPGGTKRPSGNTWVTAINPHTVLQFGDNYAKTINPNTQAIWQKELEVIRPEQNRIDLRTKLKLGAVTISSPATTLNATFPSHSEARSSAAFDGSTNYWASAIGTTSGTFQVDLQQVYHIKTVGIALLYGTPENATVSLSPDGSNWQDVKTYTNATHYCVNYTSFTPIDARYVRVVVNGTGRIGLSELELYQTASTFEANAASETSTVHGILPPGYSPSGTSAAEYGVSVVKGNLGYQSNRALKLYDGSSTWRAGVKKIVAAGNSKTLEFRCRPAAIPTGSSFNFQIIGTVNGVEATVFYFAVFAENPGPTYKIKANNGSGWVQVGTATMPVSGSVWKSIKVVANESANTASLYVDGVLAGTTGMYSNPSLTTTLTGFGFGSNGTVPSGELIYFDDVDFYDTAAGPGFAKTAETPLPDQETASQLFKVSASPNPSNDVLNIKVENGAKGPTSLKITNLSGKTMQKLNYQADAASSSVNTTVQGYLPGVYVITVTQNGQIAQTKLSVN